MTDIKIIFHRFTSSDSTLGITLHHTAFVGFPESRDTLQSCPMQTAINALKQRFLEERIIPPSPKDAFKNTFKNPGADLGFTVGGGRGLRRGNSDERNGSH